jgi:hypothetical protein
LDALNVFQMSEKSISKISRAADFLSFFLRQLCGSWACVKIPEAASNGADKRERTFILSTRFMLLYAIGLQRSEKIWDGDGVLCALQDLHCVRNLRGRW